MNRIERKNGILNNSELRQKFEKNGNNLEAKYGLPKKVVFCKKCISNQRPNSVVEYKHTSETKKLTIGFDENGGCDACKQAERKEIGIDWELRKKGLIELCEKYRRNDGRYDCLVLVPSKMV